MERFSLLRSALLSGALLAVGLAPAASAHAQEAMGLDGPAIEQALGKAGTMMPGGVFRVAMPRTDLKVTVEGVPVQAGFALGSYAAFKPMDDGSGMAMVMGDLVLLDEEVPGVMSGLFANGLQVTALHNHLNQVSPHVMYLHYEGQGDPAQLAAGIHAALGASATPFGPPPGGSPPSRPLDADAIQASLGRSGTVSPTGVLSVSVPRAQPITEGGEELPPAMGTATSLNFQPTGDGRAAITGDFVLNADEVNPVATSLRGNGIEVTALHNHALGDEPRTFYMHFWAVDDPMRLATALGAALDFTASQPPVGAGQ